MPKTNDATGASAQGMQGIVQAATGRLDELDPSLNADGTVKEGFESEERDLSDAVTGDDAHAPTVADDQPSPAPDEEQRRAELRRAAEEAPLSLDGKLSGQQETQERKDQAQEQSTPPADSQVRDGDDSSAARTDTGGASSAGNSSQTTAAKRASGGRNKS